MSAYCCPDLPPIAPVARGETLFSSFKGFNAHTPEFCPLAMKPPVEQDRDEELAPRTPTSGGEPPFTNYRDIFRGCIDYIFFRNAAAACAQMRLEVKQTLGMISEADASREGGGLPSSRHPSDHLPIAADFSYTLPGT